MFQWLSRIFSQADPVAQPAAPSPVPARAPPAASEPEPGKAHALDELFVSKAARRVLSPEDEERLPKLAPLVLDRFERDAGDLPAFPSLASRIFGLIEHPTFDTKELVRLVSQDSTVSGQVLKLANSASYSRGITVANIRDAVVRLGVKEVAGVAAAAATRALFDLETRASQESFAPLWQALWVHSTTCAFGASWLSMQLRHGSSEQAFLGGMFHDVGKTAALRAVGSLVVNGHVRHPVSPELACAVAERVHVELGSRVAGLWELPAYVQTVCRSHHDEQLPAAREFDATHVVRVVSGLEELRYNPSLRAGLEIEVTLSSQALECDFFRLRALCTEFETLRAHAADMSRH